MVELIGMPDGGTEQWSISSPVGPGQTNDRNDVELVQSMLKTMVTSTSFIDALSTQDKAELDRILTAVFKSRGKFADGIYGNNTRGVIGILERQIGSPVKDGIVRPIFAVDQMGRMSGRKGTKMRELNDIWDANSITDDANSKKESGRKELSPGLFTALYPGAA